jgi:hypothetical protein
MLYEIESAVCVSRYEGKGSREYNGEGKREKEKWLKAQRDFLNTLSGG